MSQLSLFDYINGITIGSIAAEMATELEQHWSKPLLAMLIYGFITALISYLSSKSLTFRRIMAGRAIVLYDKGKFRYDGFKKARLDMNEFLAQCRTEGYFNISEIQTAVMEETGKLSFLPVADYRPVTPKDMGLKVPSSTLCFTVIIDGKILERNLLNAGKDKRWLISEIKKSNAGALDEILLATLDDKGTVAFYRKYERNSSNDVFG